MSIFDTIKNAIFGHAGASVAAGGSTATPGASSPAPAATGAVQQPVTAPNTTSLQAGGAPVDVEAVLTSLAQKSGQPSNWRTSIVDLMKLVGLDSSLQNRKQLAQELAYRGDLNDSASMNIWLHKEVMSKLAQNGGQVPASLREGAK
jgi:hypothetical protein